VLVLNRLQGERIRIGSDIWVQVTRIDRGNVRLGISCPPGVRVMREELLDPSEHFAAVQKPAAPPVVYYSSAPKPEGA
jgi:carbon storage regulator CsrA